MAFEFLKMGRGKAAGSNGLFGETSSSRSPNSVSNTTRQRTTTHRDLPRVALRDILRLNGIPTDWISCEVAPLSYGGGDDGFLIQLVIQKWHEGLLAHAPLLQQQLLMGLKRFDPASDHSVHVVVWKFAPDCAYPLTSMPSPDFWTRKPAVATKPKFDLPPSNRDQLDDGFAATEPGELR